eukprot:Nk52_evm13s147 gene=Nk52_evmTU13s147
MSVGTVAGCGVQRSANGDCVNRSVEEDLMGFDSAISLGASGGDSDSCKKTGVIDSTAAARKKAEEGGGEEEKEEEEELLEDRIASSLVRGATSLRLKIKAMTETYKENSGPACSEEEAVKVDDDSKEAIAMMKSGTGKAAQATGKVMGKIVGGVKKAGSFAVGALEEQGREQELEKIKNLQDQERAEKGMHDDEVAARRERIRKAQLRMAQHQRMESEGKMNGEKENEEEEVIMRDYTHNETQEWIDAGREVVSVVGTVGRGASEALGIFFTGIGESIKDIVEHKYGSEAAEATADTASIGGNLYSTVAPVVGFGATSVGKRVVKSEVWTTEEKEEAEAEVQEDKEEKQGKLNETDGLSEKNNQSEQEGKGQLSGTSQQCSKAAKNKAKEEEDDDLIEFY